MAVSSDTTKYLARCVEQNTAEIKRLTEAHERFKAAQKVETMRTEALQLVSACRFTLVKNRQAPYSTTLRLGEIAKALTRARSLKEMTDLMTEFHRVAGPYQKTTA